MRTPEEQVDDLLAEIPARTPHSVMTDNEPLARAVERFMSLKEEGSAHVSLTWFYMNKLRPAFGGPGVDSVRNYVREVLKRDVRTGKPI